jgi:hypothetical protein
LLLTTLWYEAAAQACHELRAYLFRHAECALIFLPIQFLGIGFESEFRRYWPENHWLEVSIEVRRVMLFNSSAPRGSQFLKDPLVAASVQGCSLNGGSWDSDQERLN